MLLLENVHDGLDLRGFGAAFDAGSGDGSVAVDDGLNDIVYLYRSREVSSAPMGRRGEERTNVVMDRRRDGLAGLDGLSLLANVRLARAVLIERGEEGLVLSRV